MIDNKNIAKARAMQARIDFNFGTSGNIDIFDSFQNKDNFTIIFMPFDDVVDGFSNKYKNHYAIVINSNSSINRKNFTCAHELYHLLYEYDENDNYIGCKESENMANTFASYFLVPEEALYIFMNNKKMLDNKNLNISDIVAIENYFQVSRTAILIRLKDESLINQTEFDNFNKNIIKSVKKNGGNPQNYIDGDSVKKTLGEYTKLAKSLLKQGKISQGKYEEYMIDAFNSQELFGNPEDK